MSSGVRMAYYVTGKARMRQGVGVWWVWRVWVWCV